MLQQTQVSRVIPKYRTFLATFPTLRSLATAPLGVVLREWSGLGYNRRARSLWQCARVVTAEHSGAMPADVRALRTLPGIGRYTAGAIASFGFGAREPAVDTNIRRVLSRAVLGAEHVGNTHVWEVAAAVMPRDAATWNHALMDIGALYCKARPACHVCPLRKRCAFVSELRSETPAELRSARYIQKEPFRGSRREQRGRVLRVLTRRVDAVRSPSISLLRLGPQVKEGFRKSDLPWLKSLLADLERDGLLALDRQRTRVRLP